MRTLVLPDAKIAKARKDRKVDPILVVAIFLALLALSSVGYAQGWTATGPGDASRPTAGPPPVALKDVSIEQRLDAQVPLDAAFRDEDGKAVRLGDYFGRKPVVLALVYYTCPQLCNQVLNGMTSALGQVQFSAGKDFEVVAVSFDPRDLPETAAAKRETYLRWYKREGARAGWHFLTGDEADIKRLTDAVGFKYTFDAVTNQYAHASGIMLVTPDGRLSRYFFGVEYAPKDLKLGLVEASNNQIGSVVDQVLLYCFHYDPSTGKYSLAVLNVVRLGGVLTIIGMAAFVMLMKRRAVRRGHETPGGIA